MYAGNSQPNEWEFRRTASMRPIQLSGEEEGGDCLLYSGPDLGGWLNGIMDGVPKAMALEPTRRRFARAVVEYRKLTSDKSDSSCQCERGGV